MRWVIIVAKTTEKTAGRARRWAAVACAALMASVLCVLVAPVAFAAEPAAEGPAASSAAAASSVPTKTAEAPLAASPSADPATARPTTADLAQAGSSDLPDHHRLPLVKAASGTVAPTSFTISGMKYLEGRPLMAGEFSFRLGEGGAALVPGASDLAYKLRRGSSLSDEEKYQLIMESGLTFYPSSVQPMPASSVAVNASDGTVAFAPITFSGASLGATATQRHQGTIFSYSVAEQVPRNADGSLKDGVTRDASGRYVYQGVAYDDSVKRIYIYAYESVDAAGASSVVLVPLGDAIFDQGPGRAAPGAGRGFVNVFNGTVLESYDGAVSWDGNPIAAGEFSFDVREVAEDGTVLDNAEVGCEASDGGEQTAAVPLISNARFDGPGRFFYAVKQVASARAVADAAVLDEASYVITVEVTQNDQQKLDAAITHVRKKPMGSDTWVDVDLAAQPSPVVWENHLKAAPGPDGGGDRPSGGDAAAGEGDKPAGGESGASGGVRPDGDASADGGADKDGGGANGDGPEAVGGRDNGQGSANAGQNAEKPQPDGADRSDKSSAPDFAQTGDDLGVPMVIAFLVVIASGVALALISRRRSK